MNQESGFGRGAARLVMVCAGGLLLGAAIARAEAEAVPALLDRDATILAAGKLTAEAFPNADTVLVDEHIRIEYNADGTSVTLDDEYLKVLTEKGKRESRTRPFYFTLPYGTVEVLLAEVIKPDGRALAVDLEKQGRVMVDNSQMSQNIFNPNAKILQVNLPDLEVGDVYHFVSRHATVKARVPDTWSDYSVFEYTAPLRSILYEVIGPASRPLCKIALRDEVKGTVSFTESDAGDGRRRYLWEVRDVPRMYEEPGMPALHTVVQRLLVSTIPDWESISRWYWKLCEPRLASTTPEMKQKAEELVAGIEGRIPRIEAMFRFVSQQIRYMGITTEAEAPGYEPHDVSTTFQNRYGVCRDKAALLVAMLRMVDVPAYPVLIHNGPRKDVEIPQPFFNHAIVCAEDEDGSYILMDPTDESTTELLPAYLCNKSYLVAHPEGVALRTSPIVPAERNMMRIASTGRIDESGTLHMRSALAFEGINDNVYRGYFARIKPEERRRFFEGALKRRIAGARVTAFELLPADIQDTSTPLGVNLEYEARDYLVAGEQLAMLPPPWLGTGIGYVNFVLGQTGLEQRKYPLDTEIACGVDESFSLDLSNSVGPVEVLPDYVPVQTQTVAFSREMAIVTNRLEGRGRFALQAVEFLPAEYLDLKQILRHIEYELRKQPLFRSVPQQAVENDIVTLEKRQTVHVADARNWTVTTRERKRILTYAGMKANSELHISFNPAWEDVALKAATVTSPDGTEHRVVPEEINMMDAGWVGQAPRYPGAKTMVVSLPGVQVGSVVDFELEWRFRDRPFFSLETSFRGFNRIESAVFEVSVPEGFPLNVLDLTSGEIPFSEETGAGRRVLTWRAGPQESVVREDSLPPWWSFTPSLFLSAGDWSAYAGEVRRTIEAAAAGQALAETRAREVAGAAATPEDKARAIRDAVALAVRPAGPALPDLPLAAITPADVTLAQGYGNTTDRAVLLCAMLRAVGLAADPVLVAPGGSRVEAMARPYRTCPQRDFYSEVLVRVPLENGPVYLNDSDQYGRLGATDSDRRPALALDGTALAVETAADLRTRGVDRYVVDVDATGDARVSVRREYYGTSFGVFHRFFAELPPEERRRHYQELVTALSQSARAEGGLVTDYAAYPGVRAFSAQVARLAVRTGDYLYLTLPGGGDDPLNLRADVRTNPLYRPNPVDDRTEYEIRLPAGASEVLLAPDDFFWTGPGQLGRVTCEQSRREEDGRMVLRLVNRVDFQSAVLDAADYPGLLDASRLMRHPRRRTILVKMGAD